MSDLIKSIRWKAVFGELKTIDVRLFGSVLRQGHIPHCERDCDGRIKTYGLYTGYRDNVKRRRADPIDLVETKDPSLGTITMSIKHKIDARKQSWRWTNGASAKITDASCC